MSMKPSIFWLLIFIPITVILEHVGKLPPPVIFFSAALAIVPIAALIVQATEQLAHRTGDAVGGLLNATFGNAPELIIATVALRAGLLDMVRASLIGAILANLLLALGLSFFLGGLREGKQWSTARAVGSLIGASVLAAWMSEILVGAAEGTGKSLGMTQTFIGIVFLAIVGGAAESGSAIAMARKNKMDLSVGIALGSSIQIALFVAPVLVLLSYFIAPQPLELSFNRAETGSLFMGVLIGALVCGDGQSNWYKGVQLVTVYTIIALMFYFIPGTAH